MDDSHAAFADRLGAIRKAALAGDFAAMPILGQELERLLQAGPIATSRESALALRKLSEENAVLLRATQRGLRAAQRRLAEIRGVATGLTTYSAQGQRRTASLRLGPDHRA